MVILSLFIKGDEVALEVFSVRGNKHGVWGGEGREGEIEIVVGCSETGCMIL